MKLDPMDIHDLVVVGSYELRIREFEIGHYIVEAWTRPLTGEQELFTSATDKDLFFALKKLWQECCG